MPKVKKFIKDYNKQIKIGIVILLILVLFIVLYKSLFYSNSEKASYGVRLRDIKSNEIEKEERVELQNKASEIEGVSEARIVIKGRLIKFFVTFNDGVSQEEIKNKFNDMLGLLDEKIKGYYDVTFDAIQKDGNEKKYPVIGYKSKSKEGISYSAS